jgi:peptidoglycan/xylan/chitin deacetylase (PgdA/CDA1 family)
MLTFDIDGVSGALNRRPDSASLPSFMSAREYGPSVAMPRILDMLDAYGIKASFYIPGYVAETHVDLVKDVFARGHEVAHHGYIHEPPATLTRQQEEAVLDKGIEILHGITGERPNGYRSPSWELSEHSLELLADRGFLYDSSLMGDDAPYFVDAGGKRLVEVPVHWELDDAPYYNYWPALGIVNTMASPQQVYDIWSAGFEGMYHYGRSFMLTMHPYVSGRPGRLRMVERLIQYIRTFPGVEFMRVRDVAEQFAATPKPVGGSN